MTQTRFTEEQKQQFLRDGYIVIRNAVPIEISRKAREVIKATLPRDKHVLLVPSSLATHEEVLSLFNDTCLAEIMRNEMGQFPDVISSQIAVTPGFDRVGAKPAPMSTAAGAVRSQTVQRRSTVQQAGRKTLPDTSARMTIAAVPMMGSCGWIRTGGFRSAAIPPWLA